MLFGNCVVINAWNLENTLENFENWKNQTFDDFRFLSYQKMLKISKFLETLILFKNIFKYRQYNFRSSIEIKINLQKG